jgi:hypothetical protein
MTCARARTLAQLAGDTQFGMIDSPERLADAAGALTPDTDRHRKAGGLEVSPIKSLRDRLA